MTAILAILRAVWPYLLAASLGGAAAVWATHAIDGVEIQRQKNAMTSYQSQVKDAELAAQTAAREALQQQIDQRHAADINNQQVMDDLRKRTSEAESHYDADRAFIAGLLNASSKAPISPSGQVSTTHDQSGTSPAGGTFGPREVAEQLCADTKAEDERNANKLDALIAELKPQLETKP